MFPREFYEIINNVFFTEHLRLTACGHIERSCLVFTQMFRETLTISPKVVDEVNAGSFVVKR